MSDIEENKSGSGVTRRDVLKILAAGIGGAGAAAIANPLEAAGRALSGVEQNFKKHGQVSKADYNILVGTLDPRRNIVVKDNGTTVVFPRQTGLGGQGGIGWGAFVVGHDIGKGEVYYTSLHNDPEFFNPAAPASQSAMETIFSSGQGTFDTTGRIVIGISDTKHSFGVQVCVSSNGGVDYQRTDKAFPYELSGDLDNPSADHQGVMRNKFNQIVTELAGH